jgi:hypothetical protein
MFARFHSTGNEPVDKDMLKILHKEGAISFAVFFRRVPGISSGLQALLESKA